MKLKEKLVTLFRWKKAAGKMQSADLYELFTAQIKDMISAEKAIEKALPDLIKAATASPLKTALSDHLEATKNQLSRLEEIAVRLGITASEKKCEAIEGLVAESQEVLSDTDAGSNVRDVGIIISCQKVEHYEIGSYGSLRTLALVMGMYDIATILQRSLDEEGEADKLLTSIATSINEEAFLESSGKSVL